MSSTFAGVIRRLYGDIKNFRPAQKSQAFALTTYVLTGCLVLPDLYLANYFGIDTLYLNRGGQRFLDQTHRYLGRHTSRNSMSAEMGDIDGDG